MPEQPEKAFDPGQIALQLARELDARDVEYALGGALALGFWGQPRGTVDVDLNLFLPQDRPSEVIWCLQEIGCSVPASKAIRSIREHGYCQATFASCRIDVFVSSSPIYEKARARRRRVHLGSQPVTVLDAETLTVFKMMFFRDQDILDIRKILKAQRSLLDRAWIREQLVEIFGLLDPRIVRWDELVSEVEV
jgi:hypothetical protein